MTDTHDQQQHAPSTGQPGAGEVADLEARFAELMRREREDPDTYRNANRSLTAFAKDALAEVDSLRQQVRQVEGERDTARRQALMFQGKPWTVWYADYLQALGERDAAVRERAQLRAQCEASRAVVEGWQEYWLHDRDCRECWKVKKFGQACLEQVQRFDRVWTAGKNILVDAATPPTSPQDAPAVPSANAGQRKLVPEGPTLPSSETSPVQSAGQRWVDREHLRDGLGEPDARGITAIEEEFVGGRLTTGGIAAEHGLPDALWAIRYCQDVPKLLRVVLALRQQRGSSSSDKD